MNTFHISQHIRYIPGVDKKSKAIGASGWPPVPIPLHQAMGSATVPNGGVESHSSSASPEVGSDVKVSSSAKYLLVEEEACSSFSATIIMFRSITYHSCRSAWFHRHLVFLRPLLPQYPLCCGNPIPWPFCLHKVQ